METPKRVQVLSVIAAVLFVTHFVFPILRPAIQPEFAGSISQAVANGRFVADMHNYWVKTTGVYYFPGMYTAILPMIPGIYTIRRVIMGSRRVQLPKEAKG